MHMDEQERENLFATLRSLRILLVEDDELIRESLALFFASADCPIETRESAEAALSEIAPFDIVIADYRLPGKDGIALLRELDGALPAPPRKVLLTAYMSEEVLAQAFRLGITEFIEKPFSTADLEEALHRLLTRPAGFTAPEGGTA